jgi:ABC-type multidrug transport system fused ATPase/permease subunit
MEKAELHRFSRQSLDILQANLRLARLQGLYNSTVEVLLVGSTIVVVWLAASQVLAQEMTVGALVAYLSYLTRFQDPPPRVSAMPTSGFRKPWERLSVFSRYWILPPSTERCQAWLIYPASEEASTLRM